MKQLLLAGALLFTVSFTCPNQNKKAACLLPDTDKVMVYFPKTAINYREADTAIIDDAMVFTNTYSIKPFYLFPYEVSNSQYLEFVNDLKSQNDTAFSHVLPDTLVWRYKSGYNEPYVDYYFRHPAYRDYPVVGITHKQCEMYCEWLTKKYNEKEKRKFKKVKFRLPTKYEWYTAASYKKPDKKKPSVISMDHLNENIFPWGGVFMRNKEGHYLANFIVIDESSIHREYDTLISKNGNKQIKKRYIGENNVYMGVAGNTSDAADVTAPVKSYWPNDAGIYNMAGNVEEFVAEYGITKGGSWCDPGYYLRNTVIETYNKKTETTNARGFRFVMEIIEE